MPNLLSRGNDGCHRAQDNGGDESKVAAGEAARDHVYVNRRRARRSKMSDVADPGGDGKRRAGGPILVTGASGFIGSALTARLVARGFAVRPVGREWTTDLDGCRAVVHLAARVHEPRGAEAEFRADNLEASLRLAQAAAAAGVGRFVFVSTAKVHGEASPPDRPLIESDPLRPVGPYASSKRDAERGLAAIAKRTGLELVVIRPPLVHGPGVKANLRALLRVLDRGWPLPLGAVRNRRSLVGLANLCDLIGLAVEHPAAAGEAFLAADGDDISTTDLLGRLGRLLGRPARMLPVPAGLVGAGLRAFGRGATAQSLLGDLRVDAGKARRLLGWAPKVSLDEGLAEMVAGYRNAPRGSAVPRPRPSTSSP
jgi:nucleoside-diphosphate-sugar epimerase